MRPTVSWPRITGREIGSSPFQRWTSVPQMPAISVRTRAASGSRREGRGYSRNASGALKLSSTDALAMLVFMRVFLCFALAVGSASAEVKLLRTPDGGIQPQAVADDAGRI